MIIIMIIMIIFFAGGQVAVTDHFPASKANGTN